MFLQSLRADGLAASTRNKYLQTVKVMSAWGVRKGYLPTPWILPGADLKREKHARRTRRLSHDEEQRLFVRLSSPLSARPGRAGDAVPAGRAAFTPLGDVDLTRRELRIQASNAKDREHRHIPIGGRLLAVLQMAGHDPAGEPFPQEAYVFGDDVGRCVRSPKRRGRRRYSRRMDIGLKDRKHAGPRITGCVPGSRSSLSRSKT